MNKGTKLLLGSAIGLVIGGTAQAFSFNFGDDDNWGPWRTPYGYAPPPWVAQQWRPPHWQTPLPPQPTNPPTLDAKDPKAADKSPAPSASYAPVPMPYHFYRPPRMNPSDRFLLKHRRQRQMNEHQDAMEKLSAMLFGGAGFDRQEALELARDIQAASGAALSGNFHRGSIATYGSRAAPAIWQNEAAFKSNAKALQEAAKALALELEKRPTAEQGAVFLRMGSPYTPPKDRKVEPVSADVWERFNDLSNSCYACHNRFRGFTWD